MHWELIEDPEFCKLKAVLDNVLQECTKANIGIEPHQVKVITLEYEEQLWGKGVLGRIALLNSEIQFYFFLT